MACMHKPTSLSLAALLPIAASCHSTPHDPDATRWGIVIHGGAGTRTRDKLSAEREAAYRTALDAALRAGHAVLESGGSSVDAVEAAIRVMEDSPLFNAGKGAAFTRDGTNELDASLMDGSGKLAAGGVAGVRHIKNPITAARLVMEKSGHVLMIGDGAEAWVESEGVELVPAEYFYVESRYRSMRRRLEDGIPYGEYRKRPESPDREQEYGTVGAAALDRHGNLAAGTSTGGRVAKRTGRVGDSPIIGAGTYADNRTCAASATGLGEMHMKILTTKEISALMLYEGLSVADATERTLRETLAAVGGVGGVISIDRAGDHHWTFTTPAMARGYLGWDGVPVVKLFADE